MMYDDFFSSPWKQNFKIQAAPSGLSSLPIAHLDQTAGKYLHFRIIRKNAGNEMLFCRIFAIVSIIVGSLLLRTQRIKDCLDVFPRNYRDKGCKQRTMVNNGGQRIKSRDCRRQADWSFDWPSCVSIGRRARADTAENIVWFSWTRTQICRRDLEGPFGPPWDGPHTHCLSSFVDKRSQIGLLCRPFPKLFYIHRQFLV